MIPTEPDRPVPVNFDVTIDLTDDLVPHGMPADEAVACVTAAVRRLPGAGWVSVECHRGVPPGLRWVSVYKTGDGCPQDDGAYADLAIAAADTARVALMAGDQEHHPELKLRMPDGRVRNTPADRSSTEMMRLLGQDEDAIVEEHGYSPHPPDDA